MEHRYSFRLKYSTEDQGYIATLPQFPGLSAFGESPEEAIAEAQQALQLFLESYKEQNRELPEPDTLHHYSGQLRLRMPKSLHQDLAERADEEGTSINTLIIQYIAEGLSRGKVDTLADVVSE